MNANIGHGWVVERPDGAKARCGGPALCKECQEEKRALNSPGWIMNDGTFSKFVDKPPLPPTIRELLEQADAKLSKARELLRETVICMADQFILHDCSDLLEQIKALVNGGDKPNV